MNNPLPQDARRGPPRLSDALERMAAGTEPHHMSDPFDIGEALAALAATGDAVTVYPAGATTLVMARIASVDPELPHFVLELNEGETLPPGKATFVASLRSSAKLQFDLAGDWPCLAGRPFMIAAVFPEQCAVLNRRAQQRLETPVGVNYLASFQLNGKPHELQLYDFSLGGVGMRAAPRDAIGLYVGKKLQHVRLELGAGADAVVTADLEVRLVRTFRSFLLGEQVQVGCQFTNPSAAFEQAIARLLKAAAQRKPGR